MRALAAPRSNHSMPVSAAESALRAPRQGFAATVNAIVENLPRGRQTLLFSATQTRSVADLARLSLRDPEFIAVHAEAAAPTPVKLQQARAGLQCMWHLCVLARLQQACCWGCCNVPVTKLAPVMLRQARSACGVLGCGVMACAPALRSSLFIKLLKVQVRVASFTTALSAFLQQA